MAIQIKAPAFPESVADGEVATWHKAEGDTVERDELLVEIETDKVVMEVVAPESGVIAKIAAVEGETIASEALLALLEPGAAKKAPVSSAEASSAPAASSADASGDDLPMGPAVRALVEEHKLDPATIKGSGKGG